MTCVDEYVRQAYRSVRSRQVYMLVQVGTLQVGTGTMHGAGQPPRRNTNNTVIFHL